VGKNPLNENKINIIQLLDKLFKSKLDDRGRIYVPKPVRKRLFLRAGDKMYIRIEEESFLVLTTKAIKKQLAK